LKESRNGDSLIAVDTTYNYGSRFVELQRRNEITATKLSFYPGNMQEGLAIEERSTIIDWIGDKI